MSAMYFVIVLASLVFRLFDGIKHNEDSLSNLDNKTIKTEHGCHILDNDTLQCDHVPADLPPGIFRVILNLKDNAGVILDAKVSNTNWRNARYLEVNSDYTQDKNHSIVFCSFEGLKNIEHLNIIIKQYLVFKQNAFKGLDKLKSLSLDACYRLNFPDLVHALQNKTSASNLEILNISRVSTYRQPSDWNEAFFEVMASKKIRVLNASLTTISLDFWAFVNYCSEAPLEILDISRSTLVSIQLSGVTPGKTCSSLKQVSLRHIYLSKKIVNWVPQVYTSRSEAIPMYFVDYFPNIDVLDISHIIPEYSNISFVNCSAFLMTGQSWTLKSLLLGSNPFPRLDLSIFCKNVNFQHLDLSMSKIEYMNPHFLSSFVTLKHLDLSYNYMYMMAEEDFTRVGHLFDTLLTLEYISLKANKLSKLPNEIFKFNKNLQKIDLSRNALEQIEFNIGHLSMLELLDLSYNRIKVLNAFSMSNLRSALDYPMDISICFHQNPLECSQCSEYSFIKFLVDLQKSNHLTMPELTCKSKESNVTINNAIVNELKRICDHPVYIRNVVILTTVIPALTTLVLLLLWKYWKVQRKRRNLEESYRLLSVNDTYVVFLSFCHEDEPFVKRYILPQLTNVLAERIDDSRELVCYGDIHIRIGRRIAEEQILLMDRSKVVLVIVSENYCTSRECQNEFETARDNNKPIILMFKEDVDKDVMCPEMRTLYRERTRLLWTEENGEYVLNTTWENISNSIVLLARTRRTNYMAI